MEQFCKVIKIEHFSSKFKKFKLLDFNRKNKNPVEIEDLKYGCF